MKSKYRAKIEIKMYEEGRDHMLEIRVLKKDRRFEATDKEPSITYYDDTYFAIKTSKGFGKIESFDFHFPAKNRMSKPIRYRFASDYDRKAYLKRLHHGLIYWSNYWGPFYDDGQVRFRSIGNRWYFYSKR